MKRRRMKREERKLVTLWAVRRNSRAGGWCTMTDVARETGLRPSTYLMGVLQELLAEGRIRHSFKKHREKIFAHRWQANSMIFGGQ